MGLIAYIQPPDYETRMAILRKNAENCSMQIDEDIINYIATNIKSNIRELEGAFNKIIAFSKLNKVNPSLELAEEALKDIISPDKQKEITPDLIINVVSEHFGVKPEDIISKKSTLLRRSCSYQTDCHVSVQGIHGPLLPEHCQDIKQKGSHHHYPRCEHNCRRHQDG